MSWSVPSGAVAQPTDLMGLDRTDVKTRAFEWKGPYSGLASAAASLVRGDVIETGWTCSSWDLRRTAGNLGVLTINCAPAGSSGDGGGILPIKETWSIKSVRNDVSIMAYCGPSGSNPNRAEIEAWMKEPDGELAAAHQYRNSSGEVVDISSAASLALIAKIEKGIEAVIRFYPVVTCRRVYSSAPPDCLENLGFIDSIFCYLLEFSFSCPQNCRATSG